PGPSPVVDRQMRSCKPWCHSQRGAAVNGERGGFGKRRTLFARGIRELVAPQGSKVHAYVAQHAECAVEAFTRVAFSAQSDDVRVPLVAQRLLDSVSHPDHTRPVRL